jgi:hypothetical protein
MQQSKLLTHFQSQQCHYSLTHFFSQYIFIDMQYSEYSCKRRTSYAWSVGFITVSAVLLINYSVCSILLHVWLAIKDQVIA